MDEKTDVSEGSEALYTDIEDSAQEREVSPIVREAEPLTPISIPSYEADRERMNPASFARDMSDIKMREIAVSRTLTLYVLSTLATFAVIFFEGFNVGGFDLPDPFLNWLGAATIGEIAGLLVIIFKDLFS